MCYKTIELKLLYLSCLTSNKDTTLKTSINTHRHTHTHLRYNSTPLSLSLSLWNLVHYDRCIPQTLVFFVQARARFISCWFHRPDGALIKH